MVYKTFSEIKWREIKDLVEPYKTETSPEYIHIHLDDLKDILKELEVI